MRHSATPVTPNGTTIEGALARVSPDKPATRDRLHAHGVAVAPREPATSAIYWKV
jgi:hypothetical protein